MRFFGLKKKVLYLGRLMFQRRNPWRAFNYAFNSIKTAVQKKKIGFLGNFSPDLDSLFGEITGRYLISTQNKDEVQRYLKKTKTPYEILGTTDNSGIFRFRFYKKSAQLN